MLSELTANLSIELSLVVACDNCSDWAKDLVRNWSLEADWDNAMYPVGILENIGILDTLWKMLNDCAMDWKVVLTFATNWLI